MVVPVGLWSPAQCQQIDFLVLWKMEQQTREDRTQTKERVGGANIALLTQHQDGSKQENHNIKVVGLFDLFNLHIQIT